MSETLEEIIKLTRDKLQKSKNEFVMIHKAGDIGITSYIPFPIPTGLAELDYHLGGRCGLPAGKIIEYYGKPFTGKTTLALHAIAEVQKLGGLALFIDTEQTWDEDRAADIGVDLDKISVASAWSIESAFNVLEDFMTSASDAKFKGPILAVIDSVTGVPTQFELSNEITTEARMGQEAKQIRRGVKRLTGILSKMKGTVIFINHAVSNMSSAPFAKQSQAAGGFGIKYMSYIRLELKNAGSITSGSGANTRKLGQKVSIEIEKVKNAPMDYFKINEMTLGANGFDRVQSLFHAAVKTGYIDKKPTGTVCTMFKGTDVERQFKEDEWTQVLNELGGYEAFYKAWLEHGKQSGVLNPWGS